MTMNIGYLFSGICVKSIYETRFLFLLIFIRFCTLTETILCKNVDVKPQSMSKYYNRVRV